jgi:hypothetical protein
MKVKKWLPRKIRILFLLITLTIYSCTNVVDPEPSLPNQDGVPKEGDIRILIIGNSYTGYNDFPKMLKEFCAAKNKQVFIGNGIVYGQDLDYHARNGITLAVIKWQKWDYVILQDSGPNIGYPGNGSKIIPPNVSTNSYESIKTLDQEIKLNNPSSKTILMMPWAHEDGLTWIQGQTDTYEIMQKKIFDNSVLWTGELNLILTPVGWAFNEVLKTRKQLHYLFASDYNHPSPKGTYLMACVFFKTIFNQSPENNSYYSVLSQSEAQYFQKIAADLILQ